MVHVPYSENRVRGHVSSIRTLQHLSFLCTWGKLWRAPRYVLLGVMMTDDIIYRGLSSVGNLTNHTMRDVGIILCIVAPMAQPTLWGGVQ